MKWRLPLKSGRALTQTAKVLIALLAAMLVLLALGVAISQSFIGNWIADVVAPPGRGWAGMSGLLYILAVGVLMVVVIVAMWLVGRRYYPIARWFGPVVRRYRRRGRWPWRR
jgi:pilus assembly protein TadC